MLHAVHMLLRGSYLGSCCDVLVSSIQLWSGGGQGEGQERDGDFNSFI